MKKFVALVLIVMVMVGIGSAAHADNGEALEQALLDEYFVKVSDQLWVYENSFEDGPNRTVSIDGTFYPEKDYGLLYVTVSDKDYTWKYFGTLNWNGTELIAGTVNEVE